MLTHGEYKDFFHKFTNIASQINLKENKQLKLTINFLLEMLNCCNQFKN